MGARRGRACFAASAGKSPIGFGEGARCLRRRPAHVTRVNCAPWLRAPTVAGRSPGANERQSEAFLKALEHLLARPVQPQKRGRKPKKDLKGANA